MTIVVGFVPTPEGRAALTYAIKEAALRKTPLVIVNASRGDATVDTAFAQAPDIEAAQAEVAAAGVAWDLRQPVRGLDVADEVLTIARETGAELLVIGMRRRSPLGKLFLGSHSQHILTEAECPVVAVKAS